MIHVTSGHLKSIGLEVFLRSFSMLSKEEQKSFTLHCSRDRLSEYQSLSSLQGLSYPNLIEPTKEKELPYSTQSLKSSLSHIQEGDILLTLPTSKDQLILNSKQCTGYTNFFREYYPDRNMTMIFVADREIVALLSDHITLKEVPNLKSTYISQKISSIIAELPKLFFFPKELLISGLNPHSGENGLLGSEDEEIKKAILELQSIFPDLVFKGPIPGDTLHFEARREGQVKVYAFHDQGLAPFKLKNGMMGINITLGLPFIRMSVDHGTAFDLFAKRQANPMGSLYVLKSALRLDKND